MSNVIDNRVVEMRFDNQQFQTNVQASISMLGKLKASLKLTDAAKGLDSINNSAKQCDMSALGNGVDAVKSKFSALQVMAVTALANITNSAVNAGKRLISAFTIEPIKTGLQEYETQINAVQTILANTASKGTNLEQVNAALDELNHYADKTIYNFTEMTRNIGTFTAAGIDLDTSVNAIQGIANLAAVSGSTSQQASTAMYQLSQALATGTIRLMDWNSVVNAGMGGQVFQDALKKTSEELGTGAQAAIDAAGSFRESLQSGWLTSEVLTETLKKFTTSGANEYVAEYCGITADAVQSALEAAEAQYGEADAIDKAAEALAKKTGKNKDEIKSALEFAKTAEDAATKVKTFSQLMDTLKEAAQSGWTQTWEILIGDFEEAKALWTDASNYFGGAIDAMSNARNEMLEGWAKAGGRTMAIEAIKNAFTGLLSILKPIKEAFREVFPPITSEQLLNLTEKVRDLTAKFKLSDAQAARLKATFTGIFSIIKVGLKVIITIGSAILKVASSFSFVIDIVLAVTGAIGTLINKIGNFITTSGLLTTAISSIVKFIQNGVSAVRNFFSSFTGGFDISGFEALKNVLSAIWGFVKNLASNIKDTLSGIFNFETIAAGLQALNAAITTGALLTLKKFITGFTETVSSKFTEIPSIIDNVKGVLDTVRGSLEEWQNNLKADTLKKIAIAIGILAAAILILSTIEPGKLASSLGAITVLFVDLSAAMFVLNKMAIDPRGFIKLAAAMIAISTAVLILSAAVKTMGSLSWGELARGLVGTITLLGAVVGASILLSTFGGKIKKGALQIVILATAIKILASACSDLAALSWSGLIKGLVGIGALLTGIAIFLNNTKFSIRSFATAAGILLLAGAIKILASAVAIFASIKTSGIVKGLAAIGVLLVELSLFSKFNKGSSGMLVTAASLVIIAVAIQKLAAAMTSFGSMSWKEIGKGLAAMAGALLEIGVAMALMPSNMIVAATSLIVVAAALSALANVLSQMGGMSWKEIGKGLAALGGSLLILGTGLVFMTGTLAGAAALVVAALAISMLVPSLKALGEMSVGGIIGSLVALGGAIAVIGAASYLLLPVVPAMLALSVALGIFGVACLAVGAGITLLATGMIMLAGILPAHIASLIASFTMLAEGLGAIIVAICNSIVESAGAIGAAIKTLILTLCDMIIECAPTIINMVLTLLDEVLAALVEHGPAIADKLLTIVIDALNLLAAKSGDITNGLVDLFISVISAIAGRVGDIISAFVPLLEAIANGIVAILGPIVEGVIGPLIEFIVSAFSGFAEAITPIIAIISNAITSIVQCFVVLASFIAPIIANVTLMIQQLGNTISQTFMSMSVVISSVGVVISSVINSTFSGISEIITSIGDAVKTFLDGVSIVIESIGNAALNAGTGFEKLASAVADLTSLDLLDMAASLAVVAKGIKSIASNSKDLTSTATAMKNIGSSATSVSKAFDTMSAGVTTTVSKISSIGSTAKSSMSTMTSAVNSAATAFKSISTAAATAGKSVSTAFGSIGSSMAKAASSVSSSMKIIVNAMTKSISSKAAALANEFTKMLKSALTKIKSMNSQFSNAGRQLITQLSNGIKASKSKVTSGIVTCLSSTTSKIRSYYSSFVAAGKYLGQGLVIGILSMKQASWNAGYTVGRAAVEGEKAGQKSKSPSKLTIQAGKWFGEGLVIGIEKMTSKVYNAGYNLGDSAVTALSNSISDIASYVEDGIDSEPTIRPVLDLSNVKSGVGTLSNMLDSNSLIGVSTNTGVISSMMNANQNGATNDDVVSAIDALGRAISDMSGDTYNVNGVTYDDGSNITDAVKSLIRAARVERRV